MSRPPAPATGDPLAGISFTDVVIVPFHGDRVSRKAGALAGDPPVQLLPDLQLRRLAQNDVERYTQACESKNVNFKAYGGGGQRYAFVRHPAPATATSLHNFDPDGVLNAALALSRYLVLNAHCTECAVRRIKGLSPRGVQIVAVRPANRFYAWAPHDGSPVYLSQQDAIDLGPLLATYLAVQGRLPPRIRHAMWFCETSFRTYFYEVGMVHVVTAFEALVKTERWRATEQFRTRVPALAREVSMTGITRRRVNDFYNRRSASVHGQPVRVTTFTTATRELAVMQRLLTKVLRKAIEDRDFRALFTRAKIAARWPI